MNICFTRVTSTHHLVHVCNSHRVFVLESFRVKTNSISISIYLYKYIFIIHIIRYRTARISKGVRISIYGGFCFPEKWSWRSPHRTLRNGYSKWCFGNGMVGYHAPLGNAKRHQTMTRCEKLADVQLLFSYIDYIEFFCEGKILKSGTYITYRSISQKLENTSCVCTVDWSPMVGKNGYILAERCRNGGTLPCTLTYFDYLLFDPIYLCWHPVLARINFRFLTILWPSPQQSSRLIPTCIVNINQM